MAINLLHTKGKRKYVFINYLFIACLFLFPTLKIYSQPMTVTGSANAAALLTALTGTNVTISNVVLTQGNSQQFGTFTAGTGIGINAGAVISSGNASTINGNGAQWSDMAWNTGGNALVPGSLDAATLDFDIVPATNTLSFNFVFASEEYQYNNNVIPNNYMYNDGCRAFISGPGIAGQVNIARVPVVNQNVQVTTINSTNNTANYIWSPNTNIFDFGGRSVSIPCSTVVVQACQTYHMKMIVYDMFDWSYDAGFFISPFSSGSISVSASNNGPSCSGTPVTLTAVGNAGNGTYSWSPGGMTGASVIVNPAVNTTYTVTYTPSCGTAVTASTSVTVSANPVVSISASGPTTFCNGGSVNLTGNGATTYSWSPATGLNATSGSVVTANPTVTTTYTLTGTTAGCSDVATITITVNPTPVVSVNPAAPVICNGSSTTLTASGATSYVWSPATGLNTTIGPNVNANPSTTTIYTISGTTSGCTGTTTVTLTVNPIPVVTINPAAPSICNGSSTNLTANGATTYAWSPATGLNATSGSTVTANPSSNQNYIVTGTSSGCSATANVLVTVNPVPVISINPAAPVICNGSSVTINASGATTYSWSPATGLNATSGNSVIANPSLTTTYTITGTSLNCSGTNTVTVTVNPTPVISVIPLNPAICWGTSINITASGANQFSWSPAAGLNVTNSANVTASPLVTTTYIITGTDPNGCSSTVNETVTVNPKPVATITSNPGTLCMNTNPFNLIATPAGGIFSGTGVTGNTFSTTTAGVGGPYPITYMYVDAAGCSDTDQIQIIVNPTPVVLIAPVQDTACIFINPINLYGNPAGGAFHGQGVSGSIFNPVSAGAGGPYTITYIYSDVNGCIDSASESIVIFQNIPVTVSPASQSFCRGISGTLTASGGLTYSWSPSSGLNSTTTSTVVANPFNSTQYAVTGYDQDGCFGTATADINVFPLPVIDFSADPKRGCDPLNVQFQNLCTTGIQNAWSFGDGGSSAVSDPLHVYGIGTYDVQLIVTDANGCMDSITKTQFIEVGLSPIASFTVSPDINTEQFISDALYSFSNLSTNADFYNWTFGNGTGSIEMNPIHQYYDTGHYTVTLIASNTLGCKDTFSLAPLTVIKDGLLFAPTAFTPNNDFNNDFFLIYGTGVREFNLQIFDRWGNLVFESTDQTKGWDGTFRGIKMNSDVYMYKAECHMWNNHHFQLLGDVTLIR